jgi:predicted Zn-dependent protease
MLIPLKKLVGRAFLVLLVALVAGCSNEAKRKRHFTRAEAYFAKGQYQRAEIEYLNVMRLGPLDPQVVARLGSLYFAQGRSAEAYPLLQKAKELRPEDLDVRFKLGSLLVAHRRHADARTEAEFILGKKKDSAEGVLLLVDSVNSMESAVAARLLLTDLIRGGADTWAVRVGLAQLAMRENRNAEAAKEIEAAARLDNRAPEVEIVRANLALANKDVASAERFFALAYSNAPARSPHKLPIVRWKVQAGDRTAAKQYLSQILHDAPDFVPALALRGQIALGEQDFREADRIADAVLAWNRQSYEIRLLKARSLVLQGQPAKALEHFEQLASIYPDSAEVKYETAVAHVQNGAVNEALKSLDEAIRLAPAYAEAVILRAEIQLRTGTGSRWPLALYAAVSPRGRRAGSFGSRLSDARSGQ